MAQAAPLARPLGLAQSWERGREKNRVRQKKERSKNVSCAPLRGLGGLFNSYLKFGAYVEQQMLGCRAGQGRLADPSAVGSKHAQGLAGGYGDRGILIRAEWLDFLFNHAVAKVG